MQVYKHYWEQATPALVVMIPAAIATLSRRQRMAALVIVAGGLAMSAAFTIAYHSLSRWTRYEMHAPGAGWMKSSR